MRGKVVARALLLLLLATGAVLLGQDTDESDSSVANSGLVARVKALEGLFPRMERQEEQLNVLRLRAAGLESAKTELEKRLDALAERLSALEKADASNRIEAVEKKTARLTEHGHKLTIRIGEKNMWFQDDGNVGIDGKTGTLWNTGTSQPGR